MTTPFAITPLLLDQLADALVNTGYQLLDQALPPGLTDALWGELQNLSEADLKPAGIGRLEDFQVNQKIRRDKIHWLDGTSATQRDFFSWMDQLRLGLNQRLFLGLFSYECHYASYSPGAFYKKHLDAFKQPADSLQSNRLVSTVLYLNSQWQPGDGGELRLYSEDDTQLLETIAPEYGRMVIFLSDKFPHEVVVARRDRQSVAGWFRSQGSVLDH